MSGAYKVYLNNLKATIASVASRSIQLTACFLKPFACLFVHLQDMSPIFSTVGWLVVLGLTAL